MPFDHAALVKYGKPALYVAGGLALVYVAYKVLGGGAAPVAATATDPYATAATAGATSQADSLAAGLAMAQIQAADKATQIAADAQVSQAGLASFGQVAATAIAAASSENTGALQSLSNAFVGNVAATAQEVSSAATAAGTLGAANDQAASSSIAAIGGILAGAGALVGAATNPGMPAGLYPGLSRYGFSGLSGANTNLQTRFLPGNNGLIAYR